MATDWSKVNAILEKQTGTPTPDHDELHTRIEQLIEQLRRDAEERKVQS